MLSTLLTRLRLHGLLALVAVVALVASSASSVLAQDATPEAPGAAEASPVAGGGSPALGDAVVLFDEDGDELAQVAVLNVTDPFEEVDSDAQRGYHYVAIEVVVQNLTDGAYEVDTFDIRLVDAEGTLYTSAFASRSSEARAAAPELASGEIEAGAAVSGLLFFEVVDGAAPVMIANTNGFELFTLLADLREAVPAEGEATTIFDERGEEVGAITVDESLPALEDESDSFDVDRGETVFGANVTVENTGDDALEVDPYSMYIVDEFGYLYGFNSFFRDEEELADLPDFPTDPIEAGDSASGLVAFTLPSEVQVSYVLYVPGGEQLFIVAQPGDGSVVSGDTLTPVPPVVEETPATDEPVEETPAEASAECAELSDWAAATEQNLAVIEESPVFAAESPADVSPDELRTAAEDIRAASETQAGLDVPDLAADTNDAVVVFLDTLATILEDGADEVEGGADAEEVFSEDAIAEGTEFGDATTALAEAIVALDGTCPGLEIGF